MLRLIALDGIVKSWDERNSIEPIILKHNENPEFSYWSPTAGMVSSEFIHAAKEALNKL